MSTPDNRQHPRQRRQRREELPQRVDSGRLLGDRAALGPRGPGHPPVIPRAKTEGRRASVAGRTRQPPVTSRGLTPCAPPQTHLAPSGSHAGWGPGGRSPPCGSSSASSTFPMESASWCRASALSIRTGDSYLVDFAGTRQIIASDDDSRSPRTTGSSTPSSCSISPSSAPSWGLRGSGRPRPDHRRPGSQRGPRRHAPGVQPPDRGARGRGVPVRICGRVGAPAAARLHAHGTPSHPRTCRPAAPSAHPRRLSQPGPLPAPTPSSSRAGADPRRRLQPPDSRTGVRGCVDVRCCGDGGRPPRGRPGARPVSRPPRGDRVCAVAASRAWQEGRY